MSRADDDTQVDYSLLDDAALGDAVAAKVLGWDLHESTPEIGPPFWEHQGLAFPGATLVSWWGAGLVIDKLRAAGYEWEMMMDVAGEGTRAIAINDGVGEWEWRHDNPVRAILIAALRAKEAE